ncbi:hypothetical protein B0H16DRAFT_1469036 [Mycena metata]|uniref:Uncharacterized protein n=1 Tax=Mycena metata TaxID=1033252 RepID=A0AAD7MT82_9AGAR|nr:hypothetical protein B0H16DRAFT_1469036 [Mycena metata]
MDPNLLSALQSLIPLLVGGGQASGNTGQAAAPPLPVGAYTSNRPQSRPQAIPSSSSGHPNPNTSLPTPNILQPILGSASLGVSMSANSNQPRRRQASGSVAALSRSQISQANNGRLTAIDNHFPSTQSLTCRTRTRGRAQPPPALTPKLPNTNLHLVQFLYDSQLAFLEEHNLCFLYRLPEDTTVVSLIATVVAAMESSASKWKFSRGAALLLHHLRPHESLHLQLLGLVNKGIGRPSDGTVLSLFHPGRGEHRNPNPNHLLAIFFKPKSHKKMQNRTKNAQIRHKTEKTTEFGSNMPKCPNVQLLEHHNPNPSHLLTLVLYLKIQSIAFVIRHVIFPTGSESAAKWNLLFVVFASTELTV